MTTPPELTVPRGDLLDHTDGRPSMVEPLNRLMRLVHAMKSQIAASSTTADARERAAHVLLFPLAEHGPVRQGALAELVHADPSTVSRHVSLLVDRGLVRRVPDAQDGRASQLVATDAGLAALAAMRRDREALLERTTSAWSSADVARFADLLDRFVTDLSDQLPTLTSSTARAATSGLTTSDEKDR